MTSTTVSHIDLATDYAGLLATRLLVENHAATDADPIGWSPFAGDLNKVETSLIPVQVMSGHTSPWAQASTTSRPDSLRDNWISLGRSELSEDTFRRIEMFANLPDGWRGEGSKKLSSASLRSFLRFWEHIEDGKEPFLTLAPNGNLFAEWHVSWKRHFDIEFASDGLVYFGLLHGSDIIEGKTGVTDVVSLILARRQNPLKWSFPQS